MEQPDRTNYPLTRLHRVLARAFSQLPHGDRNVITRGISVGSGGDGTCDTGDHVNGVLVTSQSTINSAPAGGFKMLTACLLGHNMIPASLVDRVVRYRVGCLEYGVDDTLAPLELSSTKDLTVSGSQGTYYNQSNCSRSIIFRLVATSSLYYIKILSEQPSSSPFSSNITGGGPPDKPCAS